MITKQHFDERRLDTFGYSAMFTDSSKDDDRVPPTAASGKHVTSLCLPSTCSIFTGKAKAMITLKFVSSSDKPNSEHTFISVHVSWLLGRALFIY